ncbi:MAG: SDR family oxidoreductase [Spirochaetota bacterium]
MTFPPRSSWWLAGYLGQASCRILAELWATVIVADLSRQRAKAPAAEILAGGLRSLAMEFDVADGASCKALDDLEAEDFDRSNHINLTGTFVLAREAARAKTKGGSIILFSSMYGLVAPDLGIYAAPMNPNPLEYGAGKAGIVQMARYLSVSWGRRGVGVNAIAPGPFPTPEIKANNRDFARRLADKVPLGRIGQPEKIGGTVAFLASDASSYVSGATLPANGGWTAW